MWATFCLEVEKLKRRTSCAAAMHLNTRAEYAKVHEQAMEFARLDEHVQKAKSRWKLARAKLFAMSMFKSRGVKSSNSDDDSSDSTGSDSWTNSSDESGGDEGKSAVDGKCGTSSSPTTVSSASLVKLKPMLQKQSSKRTGVSMLGGIRGTVGACLPSSPAALKQASMRNVLGGPPVSASALKTPDTKPSIVRPKSAGFFVAAAVVTATTKGKKKRNNLSPLRKYRRHGTRADAKKMSPVTAEWKLQYNSKELQSKELLQYNDFLLHVMPKTMKHELSTHKVTSPTNGSSAAAVGTMGTPPRYALATGAKEGNVQTGGGVGGTGTSNTGASSTLQRFHALSGGGAVEESLGGGKLTMKGEAAEAAAAAARAKEAKMDAMMAEEEVHLEKPSMEQVLRLGTSFGVTQREKDALQQKKSQEEEEKQKRAMADNEEWWGEAPVQPPPQRAMDHERHLLMSQSLEDGTTATTTSAPPASCRPTMHMLRMFGDEAAAENAGNAMNVANTAAIAAHARPSSRNGTAEKIPEREVIRSALPAPQKRFLEKVEDRHLGPLEAAATRDARETDGGGGEGKLANRAEDGDLGYLDAPGRGEEDPWREWLRVEAAAHQEEETVVGEGAEPRSLLSAEPRPLLSAGGAYVGEWGLPPLPVPVVEDMPLCTTCLKEPRCMVTLPCAHLCVCMGCSART